MPYSAPGGTVTWPTSADFSQAKVDWAINRALSRLVTDLGDIELLTQSLKFPSATNQYNYVLQSQVGQPATAIGTYASGTVTFTGTVAIGQTPSVTIGGTTYSVTVTSSNNTIPQIIAALIAEINAGTQINSAANPTNTLAPVNQTLNTQSVLTVMAGSAGTAGNSVTLSAASGNCSGWNSSRARG
jgi:phage tail sheath gpL-like